MNAPFLIFVFFGLGLIAGAGTEIIQSPVRWVQTGVDGAAIMPIEACVVELAAEKAGLK